MFLLEDNDMAYGTSWNDMAQVANLRQQWYDVAQVANLRQQWYDVAQVANLRQQREIMIWHKL
ncbi:MAG: hypothetical protein WAT21_03715 [Saprospiraceae bacterium]